MKARPILFNTDMVKAILSGQKTQTRRALKDQPPENMAKALRTGVGSFDAVRRSGMFRFADNKTGAMWPEGPVICAHGQPGDLLYVRETFAKVPRTAYAQSTGVTQIINPDDEYQAAVFRAGWERCKPGAWIPSIHMPRWASRLTLEITDVRVERLQEISKKEAVAEGFDMPPAPSQGWKFGALHNFKFTWNSIYGNWDANPWVWVIEFKVHHCNVDALLNVRVAA